MVTGVVCNACNAGPFNWQGNVECAVFDRRQVRETNSFAKDAINHAAPSQSIGPRPTPHFRFSRS